VSWWIGAADILLTSRLIRCDRAKGRRKTCRRFREFEIKTGRARDLSSGGRSQGYMLPGLESGHGAASSI
jgi:hypothetical protein